MQPIGVRDEGDGTAVEEFHEALARLAPEIATEHHAPRDLATIEAGVEERRENISEVWAWLAHPGLAVPEAEELFGTTTLTAVRRVKEQTAEELWAMFETTSLYHRLTPQVRVRAESRRHAHHRARRRHSPLDPTRRTRHGIDTVVKSDTAWPSPGLSGPTMSIASRKSLFCQHCSVGVDSMTKVLAAITTSVDGYITGPNDGPGKGLGEGGERLHYWVFGGPWTYDTQPKGEPDGRGRRLDGRGYGEGWRGRWRTRTYEAADHWGDENPWGLPFFIVTHRPEEEPAGGAFTFVSGVDAAVERAVEAAAGKDVNIMGGADVIRQALEAGLVDELTIVIAPGRPRGRQAALRRILTVVRPRAPRRAAVAARDVHRLPDQPAGVATDLTAAPAQRP